MAGFIARISAPFFLDFQDLLALYSRGAGPASISYYLFTSNFGLFYDVYDSLFIFIPLLTMASFSRELQSGSVRLLQAAPIHSFEIVLGKFFAVLGVVFVFIAYILVLAAVTALYVPNFDWVSLWPGLMGFLLLSMAYIAIGLFISACTPHQIVSALATFGVLFVLTYINRWLTGIDVFEAIGAWLGLPIRARMLARGLFDSGIVVALVLVTCAFLALGNFRFNALKTHYSILAIGLRLGMILGVLAIIGLGTSNSSFRLYADATADRRNSLSPETADLMKRLDGSWSIELYGNVVGRFGTAAFPHAESSERVFFQEYTRINPNLHLRVLRYYDLAVNQRLRAQNPDLSDAEIAKIFASRVGFGEGEITSRAELERDTGLDFKDENLESFRILRWNNKEGRIRFFPDSARVPSETNIGGALKRVIDGPAIVGVASGHGERSIIRDGSHDYSRSFSRVNFRYSLENLGIDVIEVPLDTDVPGNVDVLVIGDPVNDYGPEELRRVEDYIAAGGDFVFALESSSSPAVWQLTEALGVRRGVELTQCCRAELPSSFVLAEKRGDALTRYVSDQKPVLLDGGVELVARDSSLGFTVNPALVAPDVGQFENRGPAIVGMSLERITGNTRQRGLVFGDADLMSNVLSERTSDPRTSNLSLTMESMFYLTDGEYPFFGSVRPLFDGETAMTSSTLGLLRNALVAVLPASLFLLGLTVLWRRRLA